MAAFFVALASFPLVAAAPSQPQIFLEQSPQNLVLACQTGDATGVSLEETSDLVRPWRTSIGFLTRNSTLPIAPGGSRGFYRLRTLEGSESHRRVSFEDGGVVLDLPPGEHGPYAASPKVAPGVTAPVPTCSWWSSLVWDFGASRPYGFPLYAWPLGYLAGANGVSLGLPSVKAISTYEYHLEFVYGAAGELPLRIAVDGMSAPVQKVVGWGDWTVAFRLQEGSASMDTLIGMGLPMAWFSATGGNLSVHPATGAGLEIWRQSGNELGLRLFGIPYLLQGPQGSSWSGNAPFRPTVAGPISVAVLPDTTPATLERFRGSAPPSDSRLSWEYDEEAAKLIARYDLEVAEGAKPPPMAMFPHQWLMSPDVATDAYDSPRGRMKLVDGGSFSTVAEFTGLIPHLPLPQADEFFDPAVLNGYLESLAGATIPNGADTYWSGKAIWRLAALVPIARQTGRNDLADIWLARVKASLEDWFDGRPPNLFRYDKTWSTVYGFPAGYQTNGFIQDHHFHWGYFIQSAALVARENPEWAARFAPAVELLIRDTANWQRGDRTFPFLNSFEPYAGHAWANGPAQFFAGNNQESSSESIHFASGVFQWGLATGKKDIRDLGIYLYTTEVEAIHRYWLNEGGFAFPTGFDWPALGMVWGNGGAYATWFGGHPDHTVYIHGINFLPVTPASLHLGRNPSHLLSTLAPFANNPGEWFDIITCARAVADPGDAAVRLAANPGYAPFDGTTKAHTYHWVHSLRQYGRPTNIRADHPSAIVLRNGDVKTYLTWNPGSLPLETRFSDNVFFTQPGRSLGTFAP